MKKPVAMILALLLCSFVFTFAAGAVDAPHYDPAAGNVCGTCHTVQLTLGSTGYNNVCQNCHRPGNPAAGSKAITLADAANPFGIHSTTGISKMYQTSHRWDGSDTNLAAGAQPPVQGQMTTNGLRARTAGQLACVRCHNQHDNSNGSFLRVKNDKDQLCLDCHRSRNVQSHAQGSHPVNITYADKYAANPAAFNAKPVNLNLSNTSSSLFTRISSAQGVLLCSTCHSAHYVDSRSSTSDSSANFANLSSGDGNLLRTDRRGIDPGARNDSANICTSCHAGKKSHNMKGQDVQCTDCHGAHVEYDPDDPSGAKGTNIYLIRRNAVSKDGHAIVNNGALKKVFFRYTGSQKEYKNSANTGVCQSCHVVPAPDSIVGYPPEHDSSDPRVCNTCHFHNSSNGSFSGACTACHGYPPTTANGMIGNARSQDAKTGATTDNPGAHETHATGRHMACITCHTGYAAKPMPSNSIDIGFAINNSTYKNFVGTVNGGTFNGTSLNSAYTWSPANGTTVTTGNPAITCSVYCHGTTLTGGAATPPTWTQTDGSQKACGACHGVLPATAPTTGSHTRHATDKAIACASCHGSHDNNDHVNGSVEWDLRSLSGNAVYKGATNGGTGTVAPSASFGSCTNISCHSSGQAADGTLSPLTYGSPAWGGTLTCGDCHKNMKTDAAAPGGHVKHAQTANITCATCHNGYTETSVKTSSHANGMVNLSFSGAAANATYSQFSTHSLGNGYGTCSNVSCHASPYGTALVTTPAWGSTACSGCHNGAVGAVIAFGAYSVPATGSHVKHLVLAGALCSQCHNGAVAGSSGGTGHLDGNIDVTGGYPANVAKHAADTYSGTCSTASCHADPYSSSSLLSPVWGTTAGCAACHSGAGTFGASGAPATGSHDKHMLRALKCGDCHSGAVAGSSGGASHADGKVDVLNGYPANVIKHAAGTYTGSCTTTCHSPTTTPVTTPAWGTQATCSTCHESSPGTGSHPRHSGLSVGATCQDCHAGAVANSNAGTAHHNGTIDVINGYPPNVAKHAANSYTGTCSAAACHGNPYGTGSVPTPVWGTASGCAACHTGAGAFTGSGGGPATGSHNGHMALANLSCGDCHAGASTVFGGDNHSRNDLVATGTIDVTNYGYPANVAKHAANSGYAGACSTSVCHGSSSPVWGATTANNQCTKCHGTGTVTVTAANRHVVAPSDATAADTGKVSANPKIGAHQAHLQFLNGLSSQGTEDDRCVACHGPLPTSGTHANGSSIPVFQGLATKNGAFTTSYSSGSCSVYCHNPAGSGGTLNSANAGTGVTPVWTNAAYIEGTLKTNTNCNVCHKSPGNPGFTASVTHAPNIDQDCSGCHGHNGGAGGATGQQHMDGIKYGGGNCDTCHGYPPLPSAVFNARAAGEYVNAKFQDYSGGGGHHSTHLLSTIVATDGFAPCLPCHPSGNHNQGGGAVLRSNVDVNDQADAGYRFDGSRAKRYNATTWSCSNISCHFTPTAAW